MVSKEECFGRFVWLASLDLAREKAETDAGKLAVLRGAFDCDTLPEGEDAFDNAHEKACCDAVACGLVSSFEDEAGFCDIYNRARSEADRRSR